MKQYIIGAIQGTLTVMACAVIVYLVYAWLSLPIVYYCDHFPVSCETANGVYGKDTEVCQSIIKSQHVAEESNNCERITK